MLQTLYVINPDSPEHTYVQLADLIEAEIRAGKLRGKIRAERDLVGVRRAMAVLRERGLIKSIQGRGTFVIQPRGLNLRPVTFDPFIAIGPGVIVVSGPLRRRGRSRALPGRSLPGRSRERQDR